MRMWTDLKLLRIESNGGASRKRELSASLKPGNFLTNRVISPITFSGRVARSNLIENSF
jgi:hypothetical protein